MASEGSGRNTSSLSRPHGRRAEQRNRAHSTASDLLYIGLCAAFALPIYTSEACDRENRSANAKGPLQAAVPWRSRPRSSCAT